MIFDNRFRPSEQKFSKGKNPQIFLVQKQTIDLRLMCVVFLRFLYAKNQKQKTAHDHKQ